MSTRIARIALASALLGSVALCGCASSSSTAGAEPQYEEGSIVHQVSDADRALAKSTDPISTSHATLWVNGLGCPQCASNIDIQLARISGVQKVQVDLSTGKVGVDLTGNIRPSPARLAKAVDLAGFTLVKIETQ